jgi:hypothetical protein
MNDDSMHGDPIDLSPLDPTRDAARFRAITDAITRDAMSARARLRASPPDLFAELTGWARPALLAAAIVLAVAIPTLARSHPAGWSRTSVASATDVMGIPRELIDLLRSPRTPSLMQIDEALASAGRFGR